MLFIYFNYCEIFRLDAKANVLTIIWSVATATANYATTTSAAAAACHWISVGVSIVWIPISVRVSIACHFDLFQFHDALL